MVFMSGARDHIGRLYRIKLRYSSINPHKNADRPILVDDIFPTNLSRLRTVITNFSLRLSREFWYEKGIKKSILILSKNHTQY